MQTDSVIRLSSFFDSESQHFHVDPENIILMSQRDRSTHLNLIDGLTITVRETSEEIMGLIKAMEDQREADLEAWREKNREESRRMFGRDRQRDEGLVNQDVH